MVPLFSFFSNQNKSSSSCSSSGSSTSSSSTTPPSGQRFYIITAVAATSTSATTPSPALDEISNRSTSSSSTTPPPGQRFQSHHRCRSHRGTVNLIDDVPPAGQRPVHHRRCRSNTACRRHRHHHHRRHQRDSGLDVHAIKERAAARCTPWLPLILVTLAPTIACMPRLRLLELPTTSTSSTRRLSILLPPPSGGSYRQRHRRQGQRQQHSSCTCNTQSVSSDSRQHPALACQQHPRPERQQRHRLGQRHGSFTCNTQSVSSDSRSTTPDNRSTVNQIDDAARWAAISTSPPLPQQHRRLGVGPLFPEVRQLSYLGAVLYGAYSLSLPRACRLDVGPLGFGHLAGASVRPAKRYIGTLAAAVAYHSHQLLHSSYIPTRLSARHTTSHNGPAHLADTRVFFQGFPAARHQRA